MKPLYEKPRVFIGSATESREVAQAIQRGLVGPALPDTWREVDFRPTESTLEALMSAIVAYDYAVLVLTPDDVAFVRSRAHNVTRGNVILELGLFLGALGTKRVFFVTPSGSGPATHQPTDLQGITALLYDPVHFKTNANGALAPACTEILKSMEREGLVPARRVLAEAQRKGKESVTLIAAAAQVAESGLDAATLLDLARDEIFFVGQNHFHILVREAPAFEKKLLDFLESDAEGRPGKREVRFLLCDAADPHGPAAWSSVFMRKGEFEEHLAKAEAQLKHWLHLAGQRGLGLSARKVPLVPTSVTFVDPKADQGLAVLTPNLFEHVAPVRPCYLLSKREQRSTFEAYLWACDHAFGSGLPL